MNLEDPGNWDYERTEPFPTTVSPMGAVVVTFSGEDFVRLAERAEQASVPVIAFVRDAALDRLAQQSLR